MMSVWIKNLRRGKILTLTLDLVSEWIIWWRWVCDTIGLAILRGLAEVLGRAPESKLRSASKSSVFRIKWVRRISPDVQRTGLASWNGILTTLGMGITVGLTT